MFGGQGVHCFPSSHSEAAKADARLVAAQGSHDALLQPSYSMPGGDQTPTPSGVTA